MEVRAAPVFGRPRGFSMRPAVVGPKSSGNTSTAGFAFAKVAFVHSGFSRSLDRLLDLRFIPLFLAPVSLAETDHMDPTGTRGKNQCVQSARDNAQCLESTLSVVLAEVFDNKRAVPFEILGKLKRNATLG